MVFMAKQQNGQNGQKYLERSMNWFQLEGRWSSSTLSIDFTKMIFPSLMVKNMYSQTYIKRHLNITNHCL